MNDKSHLFELMENGATVITPNNRLSNELIHDFSKTRHQSVHDKPRCLPYSAFLQIQFKLLTHHDPKQSHPIVLTTAQFHYLCRKILKIHSPHLNEGLLGAVIDAWVRCQFWQIDFDHPSFLSTPQTRQFQLWALELEQELNKIEAITEAQLANYLSLQKKFVNQETFVWACFDDYTPQQRALQKHFSEQGCQLYHYDLKATASQLHLYAAQDEQDEYQQLIPWIKTCLAKGEKRIAVVVPGLQTQSQSLQRLLQKQFTPEQFNISLGQALSDYPLVSHALCWIQLNGKHLNIHQARLLLHSPYLAYSQTEMLARAQLLEESKILQEFQFEQDALLKELEQTAPRLAERVKTITAYPQSGSPTEWVNAFKNRLLALGFPGEYSLNSANYQCYQRFLALFDEFKQLNLLTVELSQEEAFSAFAYLAKSTIFQAKKAEAAIQILGLLEAGGCSFDSLWFTGLTDQALPQKARLSAFIPLSLQRDHGMPHASPERELHLAKKIVQRFANSSSQVVYSYPRLSDDKPNLPSPLVAHLAAFPTSEINKPNRNSLTVPFAENYQIPLIDGEKTAGGTAILANQAKCPFRAFAEHRLHARTTLDTTEGPDAKERGQVIHKVMELLWQALGNQKTLLGLKDDELELKIEQAIRSALEPLIDKRTHSFSSLFQEVELARLKRLVHACLQWERQRPAFEVEALEQAFTIHLAGIDFRVRVDRLDRVEQEQKWVIDYKSSLPQSLPWKEERPKEPQLLLYALLDQTINGLVFAQLKAGQFVCKGLSAENHSLPGLAAIKKDENWSDYRQHWEAQLTELAEEFIQGHCPPQPLNASICQQCHFQNLCRFE
ncbi:recombinase B [Legionella nautarum]|uniref:Recombinase B n=2 Tax=Legionella nautarum TaxID=45070 RepID=A0A0W0WKM8_9GAMM|nr:recombinase B [Legionella nautarum]